MAQSRLGGWRKLLRSGIPAVGGIEGVYPVIKPILSRLLDRFFRFDARREARELDYLNGSVSPYDLECREREIAKGKFAGF